MRMVLLLSALLMGPTVASAEVYEFTFKAKFVDSYWMDFSFWNKKTGEGYYVDGMMSGSEIGSHGPFGYLSRGIIKGHFRVVDPIDGWLIEESTCTFADINCGGGEGYINSVFDLSASPYNDQDRFQFDFEFGGHGGSIFYFNVDSSFADEQFAISGREYGAYFDILSFKDLTAQPGCKPSQGTPGKCDLAPVPLPASWVLLAPVLGYPLARRIRKAFGQRRHLASTRVS